MPDIIATDEQLLAFISDFCERHRYSPSIREICAEFGYRSPGTMKYRLDRLRDEGRVTFIDNFPRTIRVVR